eukprot:3120038-Pleurochrysis_carterae.AAC.1
MSHNKEVVFVVAPFSSSHPTEVSSLACKLHAFIAAPAAVPPLRPPGLGLIEPEHYQESYKSFNV